LAAVDEVVEVVEDEVAVAVAHVQVDAVARMTRKEDGFQ
jgi:hypothetical protein